MSGAVQLRRRLDPGRGMARAYRILVHADLFAAGGTLLREWSRIGHPGRVRVQAFPEAG
jgi:predicted DNA-binding WGR domain protein